MKMSDLFEDGRIVKGVNTTADVDVNQIPKEVSKFGNKVDKDGRPPTLSKRVKGKSTNVLFNLGLASETYTRDQLPQIKNSQLKNIKHTLETVAINTIIPVQEERIIENFKRQVDKIVAGNYKPIIVDCDNKIVNGHHRYTALQMLEYKEVQIARLPWTLEQILDEGQAINNPKNTFLTKSDTAYDFLRVGKTISNLSNAKKSDNRDEPDVMVVPFGGKKEKDHLKKGLKKAGYKTQDADKPGDDAHVDENFAEGYKLQLERDKKLLVLNITNTKTGKRTEVRGKPGYEINYDPNDDLHQLLDTIGKSANMSDLMNGEVVSINPGHPDGAKAKAATTKAYNEERFTAMELACIEGGHDLNDLYEKAPEPKSTGDLFTQLENFADGKKKGKSRPGRVKRAGASCDGSVTDLRKRAKNASGEKAKMYHWCANMKSGRKK